MIYIIILQALQRNAVRVAACSIRGGSDWGSYCFRGKIYKGPEIMMLIDILIPGLKICFVFCNIEQYRFMDPLHMECQFCRLVSCLIILQLLVCIPL